MVFADEKNSFSLLSEWQLLFADEKVDDVKLQKYCINGCLGNSHIRSLIWRIVLKVLPMRKSEWVRTLKRTREIYKGLQINLNFDPRIIQTNSDADSCIVNPLSLHRANPWCQFFEDKRLRELINNDVRRTSPDIPFFQCRQIKELMSNVLFAYTKSHPKMSYRQGMHELLAPILFVLDCDQKIYQHLQDREYFSSYAASEFSTEDLRILEMLNNPEFLEHDAYSIFCKLMDLVEVFYLTKNDVSEDENSNNNNGRQCIRPRTQSSTAFIFRDHLIRVPFAKESEQDLSELNKRLENIHDVLLTAVDPTLARHLNSLQILPQVYGIRWLRLLFGREFTLLDLLSVWDLIIGAENSHEMIDYVFLALLVQIRQSLLHADYITCMHYLMKYTPVKDVNTFIRFVLYLKYPNKYPIPENMASFAQFVHPGRFAARTEWIWAKNSLSPPLEEETTNNQRRPAVKRLRTLDNVLNKIGRQALAAYPSSLSIRRGGEETTNSSSVSVTHDSSSERSHSQQNKRKSTADSPKRKSSSIPSTQKISPQHLESNGEIELMKEQISLLQSRLNDVDFIGQISAQQIRKCADEARMETPEGRRKLVEELKEVADQLTRSTVSEHFIMQHMQPPPAVPEGNRAEAVELASEVLGFQATTPSSTAAAASSNDAQTRSRLSSKTLQSSNEMIELRFDRKKNF